MNVHNNLLKDLMANLQVNVEYAEYTHCWPEWRDMNFIPSYNKLYYICSGEGWLKIDDMEFFPSPGQLFFMPAGVMQSYSTISDNTFTKYWCHFSAKLGDKNIFDVIRFPLYIEVKNKQKCKQLFQNLIASYKSNSFSAIFRTKSILLEIIAWFFDNVDENAIQVLYTQSYQQLNPVLQYIEKNLSKNVTVEELAKVCNFHPNYFIKFFKSHTGVTPLQYINHKRLEKAKKLIMDKDMSISEVAYITGFNDLCHFSKSFKNYTGLSPSEYRKINA